MKTRFLANFCLALLLLFAQHMALANAVSQRVQQVISEQAGQAALEDGTSGNGDTGNHVSLADLDNGLISAFVFSPASNDARFQAHAPFSDFFTVLSQYYSTRAPPTL